MLFKPILLLVSSITIAVAYPGWEHRSLRGLTNEQITTLVDREHVVGAIPAPGPLNDTSSKLVHDGAHPYVAPSAHDARGPCPGLNTLANHGYLPRSGIASPQQIVNAVQEGFNMGNDLAVFVAWGAFLVDGNPITNLLSIGPKSTETGIDPPAPAIVGGLDTHAVFEGDASTTRGDFYFGDNHSFNETYFDQLAQASATYGAGRYDINVAAEVRWNRIQDSLNKNPTFTFNVPRYYTAYAESAFPYRFFARGFFQRGQFPKDFHRRNGSFGLELLGADTNFMAAAHPIALGHNEGVGNYVVDPVISQSGQCSIYQKFVNTTLTLYPNPTGILKKALKENLATFYTAFENDGCQQTYPYGA